ncbi:MAG: hypothetical protein IPM36_10105 [Lewinellaceae bacterium]|nr:hypothetical protein [Lewinellaceae bacterium]
MNFSALPALLARFVYKVGLAFEKPATELNLAGFEMAKAPNFALWQACFAILQTAVAKIQG